MKTYQYYKCVAAVLLALCVIACGEDWVDTKPYGSLSTGTFWQSEKDVEQALNAMYVPMHYESTWGRDMFSMQNASDDVITGRVKADFDNIKNFIPTGREGYMATGWTDVFWMMNKANQALQGIPGATNLTDEERNAALGEAYFIRGFSHFWIAYLWGHKNLGVPFDGPENEGYGERIPPQLPSVTDNYAQIISDLEKAADLLPLFETYADNKKGRAHKAAAWGYMVKTYAYWAQFDPSKWELIPPLVDKIKNEGGRRLISTKASGKENFRAVFQIENNWSSEYMWSVTSGTQGGSEFPGVVLENTGWGKYNGWGYFTPTEELYNSFETGDPRRDITIMSFGDKFTYFGEEREYYSTNSLSGFMIGKYLDPYTFGINGSSSSNLMINQNGDNPTTRLNLPLMRFAEMLLFKAEALIMTGRAAEAKDPLNAIRNRVGLPNIDSPTLADLKRERRSELALEWTDRAADLKRWGDFDMLRMPLHGRDYMNKTNAHSTFKVIQVWPARNFDPAKHMAWPINPDEISRSNGMYKQTPGW
ncbi:Starch-binding associating with outer membrane [bacterium A37T11]|nr:Starch-binding associating with outer membrane [bacterium A37T11]